MTFRVGQKVVCVDDGPTPFRESVPFRLKEIVTIDGFTGTGCVSLAEYPHGPVTGYFAKRFRPVVERKTGTGMAILKKLLKTKSKELCGND
jgi:hypothetical protein